MHNYEVIKISKEIITDYKSNSFRKTNTHLQKSKSSLKLKNEIMKKVNIKKITTNLDKLNIEKNEDNLKQLESYFI